MNADHPSSPPPDILVPSLDGFDARRRTQLSHQARRLCVCGHRCGGWRLVGHPTWQEYVSQQEAKLRIACLRQRPRVGGHRR